MASTNKTVNLGLNNWVGTDKPKRSDFVEDNTILDSIISQHLADSTLHLTAEDRTALQQPVKSDIFSGSGTEEKALTLDFNPKIVIVYYMGKPPVEISSTGYTITNFGIATQTAGTAGISMTGNKVYLEQTQSAQTAGGKFNNLNKLNGQYLYIAFR